MRKHNISTIHNLQSQVQRFQKKVETNQRITLTPELKKEYIRIKNAIANAIARVPKLYDLEKKRKILLDLNQTIKVFEKEAEKRCTIIIENSISQLERINIRTNRDTLEFTELREDQNSSGVLSSPSSESRFEEIDIGGFFTTSVNVDVLVEILKDYKNHIHIPVVLLVANICAFFPGFDLGILQFIGLNNWSFFLLSVSSYTYYFYTVYKQIEHEYDDDNYSRQTILLEDRISLNIATRQEIESKRDRDLQQLATTLREDCNPLQLQLPQANAEIEIAKRYINEDTSNLRQLASTLNSIYNTRTIEFGIPEYIINETQQFKSKNQPGRSGHYNNNQSSRY